MTHNGGRRPGNGGEAARGRLRHPAARGFVATARLVAAPLVAIAAALAGVVFVVLLPICGIASLAEGFAKAAWDATRALLPHVSRGAMSHD
jgi:hypothetical protein